MKKITFKGFFLSSIQSKKTYWSFFVLLLTFFVLSLLSMSYFFVLQVLEPQDPRLQISTDPFSDSSLAALSVFHKTLVLGVFISIVFVLLFLLLYVVGYSFSLSILYHKDFSLKQAVKVFLCYLLLCMVYFLFLLLISALLTQVAAAIVFLCSLVLFFYVWLLILPFSVLSSSIRSTFSILVRHFFRILVLFFPFLIITYFLFGVFKADFFFFLLYLLFSIIFYLLLYFLTVHKQWISIKKSS